MKKSSNKTNIQNTSILAKSLVVISYSHWEGFIKNITKYYLFYLKNLSLTTSQASPSLLHTYIAWAIDNKNIVNRIELLQSCLSDPSYNITQQLDIDKISSTESNLSSEVLRKIMTSIGADYSIFELKKAIIDEKILQNRHAIAHGEYNKIEATEAIEIADSVLNFIDQYKTIIENLFSTDAYKQ